MKNWRGCPAPGQVTLEGARVRLEPLSEKHLEDLYALISLPGEEKIWDYMPYGPFPTLKDFQTQMKTWAGKDDWITFAIINRATGKPEGSLSLMRINPAHGVIEVGAIWFTEPLRKTAAATEALFLIADYAMTTLGYRRYEWKCHNENAASKRAALRLGFTFEGVFRQAMVLKGKNRDTAWFSILDCEWPRLRKAYLKWLDPSNFDAGGKQKKSLQELLN